MLTKKKKILLEEETILILSFLILLTLVIIFRPTITGYVVYENTSPYIFSFSNPSDYIYNSSLINLINNEVKLSQQTTQTATAQTNYYVSQISSAIYNSQDRTSKLQNLDNEKLNVNKDNILDVTFDHALDNNDIITIYLEDSQNSDIYLCAASTQCSSPGYGLVNYPGTAAYYNLTISNLPSPVSTFNIDPPGDEADTNETEEAEINETKEETDEAENNEENFGISSTSIKFNHIYATYAETTETTTTTLSYPSSATLETQDLEILNLNKWEILTIDENLNSQQVNYYYSTDSGATYILVPEDKNLSAFSQTKKIRIKAELISDTISTPILNQLSLAFSLSSEEQEENQTYYKTITDNNLNLTLTIFSLTDLTNSNLASSEETTIPAAQNFTSIKKINLNPDSTISNNMLWASLKIYYNETELTNLDETTLRLYYYNETRSEWQELNSVLNINENYLLINLTHLSVYGIFGQESQQEESSSDSGPGSSTGSGGGSSGGGSSKRGSTTIIQETEIIQPETIQERTETSIIETTDTEAIETPQQEKPKTSSEALTGQVIKNSNKFLEFSKKNLGIFIALAAILITYIIVRIEKNIKRKKQNKLI